MTPYEPPKDIWRVNSTLEVNEPLDGAKDPRWVDTYEARGEASLKHIAQVLGVDGAWARLREPPAQGYYLFCGHRGSGKSTELRHLRNLLDGADLFRVVFADATIELDVNNLRYQDILLHLAAKLSRQLADEGCDIHRRHLQPLYDWFVERVEKREETKQFALESKAGAEGKLSVLPLVAKVFGSISTAFKTNASYKQELRLTLQNYFSDFAAAFNELVATAECELDRRVLFVVDGTDRLRTDDAKAFFVTDVHQLQQVRGLFIYGAPIHLAYEEGGQATQNFNRVFDLFVRLMDNGTFDGDNGDLVNGDRIRAMCRSLADDRPEWVAEMLAHHLRRCVVRARAASAKGQLDDLMSRLVNAGDASEAIEKVAERKPKAFVNHVLPAVLEISEAALTGGRAPVRDAVWPCLIKDALTLADACLHALADALVALAGEGEDMRHEIANLSNRDTYVANFLLLSLYRGDANRYADEAVLAFCHQPWRFDCGYSDNPFWSAKETIAVAASHCDPTNLAQLEGAILTYVHPYELTKEGTRQRGFAAYNLLDAIPNTLRSAGAEKRFGELGHEFGPASPAPRGFVGGWAPSPSGATEKMDDDQWLTEIETYGSPDGRELFGGGAVQLARQFGSLAAKEPDRFANIGLRLPSTTNPVYFSELLRGLTDTSIADAIKIKIGWRAFECARSVCGGDIANLLASTSAPLPDDAVQMLVALATEAQDADEDAWRDLASSGQPYDSGEIHNSGISTMRGQTTLAIGRLIGNDASYIQRFDTALDELAADPSPAVASCAAMTIRTVAYHDAERGLSLFQRMDFSEERLLATRHVYGFMRENLWRRFANLEGVILQALRSAYAGVRQTGARLACHAALHHADAEYLADEARDGDSHQRRGVAKVASEKIGDSAHQDWCKKVLKRLFTDDDAEVRKISASCFRHVGEDRIHAYGDLIKAFCTSPAFAQDPFFLLHALKNARSRLPGTVCLVCESFLDNGRGYADGHAVVELIFRLYQHHRNDEWTTRALDLIDRACLELDGAAKGFDDFDR